MGMFSIWGSPFPYGDPHMETGRQTKKFPFGDSPFPNRVCAYLGINCPRGSRYALAARALPSRLGLCPCSLRLGCCPCKLRYVLAAQALLLPLALLACGLDFALAAWALPLRLGLCSRGLWLAAWASPSMRALGARDLGFALANWALPSQLGLCPRSSRYALAAWALLLRLELWLRLCPRGSGFARDQSYCPLQQGGVAAAAVWVGYHS
jgi:hypothetical protein